MSEQICHRMEMIALLAKEDDQYFHMLQEMQELEKKYHGVLQEFPTEQLDIICDFVSQCEDMSWRMLELACTYMRFPE